MDGHIVECVLVPAQWSSSFDLQHTLMAALRTSAHCTQGHVALPQLQSTAACNALCILAPVIMLGAWNR